MYVRYIPNALLTVLMQSCECCSCNVQPNGVFCINNIQVDLFLMFRFASNEVLHALNPPSATSSSSSPSPLHVWP